MYFLTGLGQVFRPRKPLPTTPPAPKKSAPPLNQWVARGGDRRFCGTPSGNRMSCDLELKVKFRSSYEEFAREVENAYARWMEPQTARLLIKTVDQDLRNFHQYMVSEKMIENDPMILSAGLYYKRSNGGWLVYSSTVRGYRRLIDI